MLLTDDKSRSSRSYPSRANMISAMKWLVEGAQMHDSLFLHCTSLSSSWIPGSTSGRWMCSCPLPYSAQIQAMVSTVVRIRSGVLMMSQADKNATSTTTRRMGTMKVGHAIRSTSCRSISHVAIFPVDHEEAGVIIDDVRTPPCAVGSHCASLNQH